MATLRSKLLVGTVGALAAGTIAAGAVTATAAPTATAASGTPVTLASKNGSGISGTATYGSRVIGRATGMDPSQSYYSFTYGNGSNANGNNPCVLTGETLAGPINTIGKWSVDKNGNGTLNAPAPVSAKSAGTMSIRRDDSGTGGAAGPLPINQLVACGQVGPRQTTPLGSVQDQLPKLPSTPGPKVIAKNPTAAAQTAAQSVPTTVSTIGNGNAGTATTGTSKTKTPTSNATGSKLVSGLGN